MYGHKLQMNQKSLNPCVKIETQQLEESMNEFLSILGVGESFLLILKIKSSKKSQNQTKNH